MSGAYLRYAKNIRFENFVIEADDDMKEYLAEIYDVEDCEDVVVM